MAPHQTRPGSWSRHSFGVTVRLTPTREEFAVRSVRPDMLVSELQDHAEFATGIPVHMQQLCYLDEGILQRQTDVRSNDIIPGAQLHLDVWSTWSTLVTAAASNDIDALMRLGVTSSQSAYKTPVSEFMDAGCKAEWLAERAFVALYIAAHRGHLKLCRQLVEVGANVNASTPQGRTVLHVAASQGHGNVIDFLLEKGADIDAADVNGDTALSIAGRYDHKDSERHLFLFRWQQRAMEPAPRAEVARFAHQFYDSKTPVWMRGDRAQFYLLNIAPPDSQFSGTGLGAPHRKVPVAGRRGRRGEGKEGVAKSATNEGSPQGSRSGSGLSSTSAPSRRRRHSDKDGGDDMTSFEEWLARKQAAELVVLEEKRRLRTEKKKVVDDKKKDAEIQNKSYEKWLETNEGATSPGTTNMPTAQHGGTAPPGGGAGSGGGVGSAPGGEISKQKSDAKGAPRTMKDIIRDIMRRREQRGEVGDAGGGITHDMWMTMTNADLYKQMKSRAGYVIEGS